MLLVDVCTCLPLCLCPLCLQARALDPVPVRLHTFQDLVCGPADCVPCGAVEAALVALERRETFVCSRRTALEIEVMETEAELEAQWEALGRAIHVQSNAGAEKRKSEILGMMKRRLVQSKAECQALMQQLEATMSVVPSPTAPPSGTSPAESGAVVAMQERLAALEDERQRERQDASARLEQAVQALAQAEQEAERFRERANHNIQQTATEVMRFRTQNQV